MRDLPEDFARHRSDIVRLAEGVRGLITRREMEFLVLLGACPTAEGEILEIGSYMGRSAIVLSKAAALAGGGKVVAVDPMGRTPSEHPRVDGHPPWREAFGANLEAAGVAEKVEFHQSFSGELAESWNRAIRLLWIDGLHTYEGVKADFDGFAPHLADGAIIAMHDVLHLPPGPIRVFAEDVLLSDRFGAAGLCGAIGWAQYRTDPAATRRHVPAKTRLHRKLASRIVSGPAMLYRVSGVWRTSSSPFPSMPSCNWVLCPPKPPSRARPSRSTLRRWRRGPAQAGRRSDRDESGTEEVTSRTQLRPLLAPSGLGRGRPWSTLNRAL